MLVCSKLAFSAYNTLKDAPKEFEGLRLEVLSLNATLKALAEEANSPNSIILLASPQRQESLRVLLENCSKGLEQLHVLTRKFPSLGTNEKTKFLEHVKFALQNKNSPRDKLAIHTSSINIFLTSLTHSSLGRLEGLVKNALRGAQQKQQNLQSQFSNAGYDTLGTKSISALSGGYGSAPTQSKTKEPDVWASIAQDLDWEGIRPRDIEPLREEVVAYIRYLHNGGDPFWKRGGASKEQNAVKHEKSKERYGDGSYGRNYEAGPPQMPMPVGQAPPAYSPPSSATQKAGFGKANQPAPAASRKQPRPPALAPPAQPNPFSAGSAAGTYSGHALTGSSPAMEKPSPFAFGQPGSAVTGATPFTSDDTVGAETKRLEKLVLAERERLKQESAPSISEPINATTPADARPQQGSSLFGNPQSTSSTGSGFGTSSGSGFGSSPQSKPPTITSGSLFGSKPATAPAPNASGLFGSLSGSQQPSQPPSSGLYGAPQTTQSSGLFGSNAPSLFGQAPVNQREFNEMADLFDHMFDVDDAEEALAQGAAIEVEHYQQPPPPIVPVEVRQPTSLYGSYQRLPESEPAAGKGTVARQLRMPTAITPDTPLEVQRDRVRYVKNDLHVLLEDLYAAYRAGDSRTPSMLLNKTPSNNASESPIHARVAYLRTAGVIVIQCDLCSIPVEDYHWHCDVCADGDWDCCFRCRTQGRGCPGGHGYLARRSARDWEPERYWTNL